MLVPILPLASPVSACTQDLMSLDHAEVGIAGSTFMKPFRILKTSSRSALSRRFSSFQSGTLQTFFSKVRAEMKGLFLVHSFRRTFFNA